MDKNEFLSEYRTGDVAPPKNHRWLITLLLLTVIFLGGLVSALGFANIHLFRTVWGEESHTSVRFIKDVQFSQPPKSEDYTKIDSLGIQGRFLSDFDQRYFALPPGVYISTPSQLVPELQVGDVLMKINGRDITDQALLDALVDSFDHGITLSLLIYRNGEYQTVEATLVKNFEEN